MTYKQRKRASERKARIAALSAWIGKGKDRG